jgi:serine/threonine protein phosphatase 1
MKKTYKLPVSGPKNKRIVAIGDVHGQYEMFKKTCDSIPRPEEVTLILLGDYIDRGPDSDLVIEHLHKLPDIFKEVIILPGNHEQMAWLGIEKGIDSWANCFVYNGGAHTLAKYEKPEDLIKSFPKQLIDRLSYEKPLWHQEGQILFIHAGIDPEYNFDTFIKMGQEIDTCNISYFDEATSPLWIRYPFYGKTGPYKDQNGKDVLVVYGHTRIGTKDPNIVFNFNAEEVNNWRISMDNTGAPFMTYVEILGDEATMHVIEKP